MITIVKRNGSTEPLSEEKYNRVVMWGVENIRNVSASAIAMGAAASIFDGMTTSQLHEALVKSAADLISKETPNYSQVAARLSLFKIRKDAFGQYAYRSSNPAECLERRRAGGHEASALPLCLLTMESRAGL